MRRTYTSSMFLIFSRSKNRGSTLFPRQIMSDLEFNPHRRLVPHCTFSNKMPGEAIVLKYSKLSEKAYDPVKGTEHAAGFDLRSAYNYTVKAHGKELVKTDLQVQVPRGCYGRIAPRSGLAWKNFIDIGAGVIDIDYRGNVGVVIFNHGDVDFVIQEGDRIAQLICEKIEYPVLQEVTNLEETVRGSGGFGSTGTK